MHQASGNGAAQAIGLLGIPILSRIYSPQDFAIQSIFLQVAMFLAGIITWRYEYFFQLLDDARQSRLLFRWIVKLGVICGAFLTLIFYLYGSNLAASFGAAALGSYLVFCPLTALFISLGLALQHHVQRSGQIKISAATDVSGKLLYVLMGILMSPTGVVGLIATIFFSAFGKIVFLWRSLVDLFLGPLAQDKMEAHPRSVHKKGANAMVFSHLFLTIGTALPILFISYRFGVETLGQFTMVMSTIFLPSGLIGLAIGQVFYQRAAKYFRDSKDIRQLWLSTVYRLIIFGFPIYAVAVILSSYIYPMVLGEQWKLAGQYAQIFSVAAFFAFISTPLDRIALILRINKYLPIMHFFRMLSAVTVIGMAEFFNLNFWNYLILLTLQMSLIYLLDLIFGWVFLNQYAHKKNISQFKV